MLLYVDSEKLAIKTFQAVTMYSHELLSLVNEAADQDGEGWTYILAGIRDIQEEIREHINEICKELNESEGKSNEKKNTSHD